MENRNLKFFLVSVFLVLGFFLFRTPTQIFAQEFYGIQDNSGNWSYSYGGSGTEVAGPVTVVQSTSYAYETSYVNSQGQLVVHVCTCNAGCCGGAEAAPAPAPAPSYVPPPPGPGVDPGCQGACGFLGCGCGGTGTGGNCPADQCCGSSSCSYSDPNPPELKDPSNNSSLPVGDVTLSWYMNGPGDHRVCDSWSDSGRCERRHRVYDEFDFGNRRCGRCSSRAGVQGLGGYFALYLGSDPRNLGEVYRTRVYEDDETESPDRLIGSYTIPSPQIPLGQEMYWRVYAVQDSDQAPRTGSEIWSFNIDAPEVIVPVSGWWQVEDGDVYAGGNLVNLIPAKSVCSGNCKPILLLDGESGDPGVVGYQGTLNLGEGSVSSTNWLVASEYKGKRYGFEFWRTHVNLSSEATSDWGSLDLGNASKPSLAPVNQGDVYYADGDMTIANSTWQVASGEKIVVLVRGDVNIKDRIKVANGGFLAIVAQGDVKIGSTVNSEDDQVAVEGVFIADGVIDTGTATTKLILGGTYVGWQGVNLKRDFETDRNDTEPVEVFRYRPDLIANVPLYMKRASLVWEEVAP